MNKKYLLFLGVAIAFTALIVSVANLGITLADITGSLNLMGDK